MFIFSYCYFSERISCCFIGIGHSGSWVISNLKAADQGFNRLAKEMLSGHSLWWHGVYSFYNWSNMYIFTIKADIFDTFVKRLTWSLLMQTFPRCPKRQLASMAGVYNEMLSPCRSMDSTTRARHNCWSEVNERLSQTRDAKILASCVRDKWRHIFQPHSGKADAVMLNFCYNQLFHNKSWCNNSLRTSWSVRCADRCSTDWAGSVRTCEFQ